MGLTLARYSQIAPTQTYIKLLSDSHLYGSKWILKMREIEKAVH